MMTRIEEFKILPTSHKAKLLKTDGTTDKYWVHGTFCQHTTRQLYPLGGDYYKKGEIANLIINDSFSDWGLPKQLQSHPVDEKTVCEYTGFVLNGYGQLFTNDIVKDEYGNEAVVKYGIYFDENDIKRIGFYFDFEPNDERNNILYWKENADLNDNKLTGLTCIGNLFDKNV